MWLFFFILFALWASIGSLLLYLKNKPTGTAAYLRKVDKPIYNRAETVNVTLELTPPVATSASVDKHDVLLVLDHSGSMGSAPGSPLRESVRAMENFVKQLPKSYHIGLIIFDHEAQRLCNITPQKEEVLGALKTISPGGATELHLALDISREALDEGRGEVKKTLILLSDGGSDRKAADHSAAQVKEHPSKPTIICVGFGAHVDEDLMKSVASTEQHYIHVETADHLAPLFELLVGVVSGQSASAVLVNEKMMAPRPFHLDKTGEIYPVGIHQTETNGTEVAWFLSLLQRETVSLNYRLQPECLGWHTVAPADAQAHWKMPEGDQQTTDCAAGPKVLILPNGFAWTGWWLLNPLFWLIFGPLFKCVQPTAAQDKTELEDLPVPDVPKPLSVPESTLYVPKLRPALVIGLGALGEWSLSRLKWQLQDRQIDKDVVDLLVIQDSSVHNRPSVTVNGGLLDDSERVILQADLRPYLEELRHQDNTPDSRSWIPWRQWLRESRPLTTYTDDRRKARLALLLQPEAVEKRIKDNVARILKDEGIILIVAGAGDAEGSGMLAEVAHICASHGAGVTAILVPERTSSPETTGMVKELERILIMRGESIPSDRGGKTVSANKLFDRVIVANQFQENAKITSKAISHLLWDILAYPEMLEKMPSARNDDCYQVKLQGQALPQRSLWHWVRERTLSDLINQQWLKSTITANQVEQPVVNTDAVKEYVATFWNGDTELLHQRLPSKLLKKSALVVRHANPLIILEEALEIPLEKPYHEQKAYCDLERVAFSAYLEAWCYYMLEREKGQWGLPTLLEAVTHIEQDFEKLIESVNRLSGNTALVEQLSFISSIYTDYHVALGGLRSSLEHWIAVFVGWQPGMKVNPLPQDFVPACIAIEKQRQQAEADLPFQRVQDTLVPFYKNWYDQYGNNFLQQLRFQVKSQTRGLVIQLQFFGSQLVHSDNLTEAFREALDRYKDVVFQWPTDNWVTTETVPNPANSLRLGKYSRHAYGNVNQAINEDDPFITAAFSINPSKLEQTFHLDQNSPAIYAWAEEANAMRIADKIRHLRQREPLPFSAKVVSFLRDAGRLHSFMADLAENRLTIQEQNIMLNRADREFKVGSTSPQRPGIEMFEDVVRQVVALGISLENEQLPPPLENWTVAPEEAVRLVEQNPLAMAASESPEWEMWKDVIMGLALG